MLIKLLDWLYGVVVSPSSTLGTIAQARPAGMALLVYLGVSLLVAAASLYSGDQAVALAELRNITGIIIPTGLILAGTMILALFGLFAGTGLLHLIARIFGGSGDFWGFFSAYAIADFPMIFNVPVLLVSTFLGLVGSLLSALSSLGLSVWIIVLGVIAIKESHGLSVLASIGTMLVGMVVVIVAAIGMIFALIIAALLIL